MATTERNTPEFFPQTTIKWAELRDALVALGGELVEEGDEDGQAYNEKVYLGNIGLALWGDEPHRDDCCMVSNHVDAYDLWGESCLEECGVRAWSELMGKLCAIHAAHQRFLRESSEALEIVNWTEARQRRLLRSQR